MSGSFAAQKSLRQTTQVIVNLWHHLANRGGLIALATIRFTRNSRSRRIRG
jgi:hypothetical protein